MHDGEGLLHMEGGGAAWRMGRPEGPSPASQTGVVFFVFPGLPSRSLPGLTSWGCIPRVPWSA